MVTALLIVDVQNDFTEGGALAVTGGDQVAEGITRYLSPHPGAGGSESPDPSPAKPGVQAPDTASTQAPDTASTQAPDTASTESPGPDAAVSYAAVIASRDWHDADNDNGGHFGERPDFVDTWPVHCVADTPGAEYDPLFDTASVTHHVRKGQGIPAYSAFEGTTEDGTGLGALLDELGITAVDVVGIATDHCVRATVLDALDHGLQVRVLRSLVAGVGEDSSAAAIAEVKAAGARLG